jgi:membrane protein
MEAMLSVGEQGTADLVVAAGAVYGYREAVADPPSLRQRVRRVLEPVPGAVSAVRLVVETVVVAFRYRATGLAAEGAFFTLLSVPPLLLALVAGAGFATQWLAPVTLSRIRGTLEEWSLRFLTPDTVEEVIMPTFDETLAGGRADFLSVGFLIALWSGSRALHIFLDGISIMYGQGGRRGPVKARALSLTAYLVSVVVAGVMLPLLLVGPTLLRSWLPDQLAWVTTLYWPVATVVGVLALVGLFHVATPERSPFFRDLPGAVLTIVAWRVSSALIRVWAGAAAGGTSVFGPLTVPIILLVYLYFLAFSVLLGACFNAAVRRLWPPPEYRGPRVRAGEWWDDRRASREARRREREELEAALVAAQEGQEVPPEEADGVAGPR